MRDVGWKRGQAAVAVLAAAAALLSGCSGNSGPSDSSSSSTPVDTAVLGEKKAATGSPVKIGLFNVEGGSAVSSPEIADAAAAAASYANDYLGGLGGHRIEIVRCGDKADGASAAACGNTFVQERVAAVVTGQPATADQIVPTVRGAGIPWVGSSPAAPSELGNTDAFFFSSGFIGLLAGEAVYAKKQGWKRVTMMGSENPQVVAAVNGVGKPLFQSQGVTLDLVTVPQGTADASSQVAAATRRNPDALSIVADATGCQAVLSAIATVGATQPKMVNAACVSPEVIDAVGEAGIDRTVLFANGDTLSDDKEAQLYRAVMQEYASKAPTGGLTPVGFLSMLGFVRAVNAGGLTGDATPQTILAALRAAKDVPLPIGAGQTFSCDKTQFPYPAIKATICNSKSFVTTYTGVKPGTFEPVDAADALAG
ncbi:ABC transporter substrate-binding protein [Cryptosporangium aurantiacum]|uniref:Branched-chain amino acid transport system substrate-binding protein n=1 Tax=Cryptosporangium aurantiacum TaxID=134849 RepID=A0A1M7R4D1_9ACTN|nr:ABC transporter substrate-binding protein [Cryptosporangium aurantiacum]SHN39919.1 branched-chain amino acid transport system substrate-binding protein [Cryptosporangium aurantiacum]